MIKLAALVTMIVVGANAATAPAQPVVAIAGSAAGWATETETATPAPRGGTRQQVTVVVPEVFEVSPSSITAGGDTKLLLADLRETAAGWRLVATATEHAVRIDVTGLDPILGSGRGIRVTRSQTVEPGEDAVLATARPGRGTGSYWIELHVDGARSDSGSVTVVVRIDDAASRSLDSNL